MLKFLRVASPWLHSLKLSLLSFVFSNDGKLDSRFLFCFVLFCFVLFCFVLFFVFFFFWGGGLKINALTILIRCLVFKYHVLAIVWTEAACPFELGLPYGDWSVK